MRPWLPSLDQALRALIPFTLTLFLVLLTVVPWRLAGFGPITPCLALIAVFYWSIYRPDRLPYTATFLLGLIQDLLSGSPVGLTSLVLLMVQGIVISQRRFFLGKSFLVVWWAFLLVAPAAALTGWAVSSLFFGSVLALGPVALQCLLAILLYPPLTWVLARAQTVMTRHA